MTMHDPRDVHAADPILYIAHSLRKECGKLKIQHPTTSKMSSEVQVI